MVAVSYGYMALMMTAIKNKNTIVALPTDQTYVSEEINLRLNPDDTYFFDGLNISQADSILNNVTFYNELVFNIPLKNFLAESMLS